MHDPVRIELRRILAEVGTNRLRRDRTTSLEHYLGSPVPVLGLSASELRAIVRESARRWKPGTSEGLHRLCIGLWMGRVFEQKALAIELLRRHARLLNDSSWALIDRWVGEATGWALSDALAGGLASKLVVDHPEFVRDLELWSRSPNPWRRRASLYALSGWIRENSLDRPFELLDRLLADPDPWVQRAAGTWLRECWKRNRGRTEKFLLSRARRLPAKVVTIATERSTVSFRQRLRNRVRRAQMARRQLAKKRP